MPPEDFMRKLEKERPELFKSKRGQGDSDRRARREIFRREYEKAQAQGQQ